MVFPKTHLGRREVRGYLPAISSRSMIDGYPRDLVAVFGPDQDDLLTLADQFEAPLPHLMRKLARDVSGLLVVVEDRPVDPLTSVTLLVSTRSK